VRIAFQGELGAFSHEALLRMAPGAEPWPEPSFTAAAQAVRSGRAAGAVLPVENNLAGPVEASIQAIAEAALRELGRIDLPVRMMLIGSPGAELGALETVASHPVALRQCRKIIAELGLKEEFVFDTAGAARMLAERPDPRRAVLASRAAADRHHLPVLRADVQDRADNRTTFLLLAP
jgi:prephenate dehydratase